MQPSPRPRRVSRPRWLDARLVLGIVLVAASVLLGVKVVGDAHRTRRAVALTRDVAAGTLLDSADLRTVDVALPDGTAYLDDLDQAVGKVVNRSLGSGELVPAAALGTAPPHTVLTVPLGADAAPPLQAGQRIEIWLSTDSCPSVVLLADVPVQDVRQPSAGGFSADGGQDVVLRVPSDQADRVVTALALSGATLRAGVLSGSARVRAPLPSLDQCGRSGGS